MFTILGRALNLISNSMNLPEPDYGPEVFETSDVESIDQLPYTEKETEDIDAVALNPEDAKKHFEHEIVDSLAVVDFLDLAGPGFTMRRTEETTEQKLARIAAELEQIRSLEPEKTEVEALAAELESLAGKREVGYYGAKLRKVFEESMPEEKLGKENTKDTSSVLKLELRLSSLEDTVGVSDLATTRSLRNHVKDMARRVDVLYDLDTEMASLKAEIKRLNKEMETLNTNRRLAALLEVAPVTAFEAKVDTLYEKLPEFERTNTTVPQIIARLKSLHHIHADMGYAVSATNEIDKTIHDLRSELQRWESSLDEVNSALDKHNEIFEANKRAVESRMKEIETRVDKMK